MGKYLTEADQVTAMHQYFVGPAPSPLVHTVWTGDFMGMCMHDIACPVCFNASAILERTVTPGQWRQEAQPCWKCQHDGWRIRRGLFARLLSWIGGKQATA